MIVKIGYNKLYVDGVLWTWDYTVDGLVQRSAASSPKNSKSQPRTKPTQEKNSTSLSTINVTFWNSNDITILGGDVNATVAAFDDDLPTEVVQRSKLGEQREYLVRKTDVRGELVMNFMIENGFTLVNGRTLSDSPARFSSSRALTTYDLIWVNTTSAGSIEDLKISSNLLGSNHLPLHLMLSLQNVLSSGSSDRPLPASLNRYSRPAASTQKILKWDPKKWSEYTLHLTCSRRILEANLAHDANELNELITWALKEATSLSRMKAKALYRKIYNPEYNQERARAFDENNKEYKNWILARKGEYKNAVIEKFANVKSQTIFWKNYCEAKDWIPGLETISLAEWNDFIRRTYSAREIKQLELADTSNEELDYQILTEELKYSINSMKAGKAPGEDSISSSFYKFLSPEIVLRMIFKKGEQRDTLNYRGITLINNITKLFTSIINTRLYNWAERLHIISEEQAVFRRHRGALDNLFSLQVTIQNRLRLPGGKVYALFVDYRRAFDAVPQFQLWSKLLDMDVSPRLIKVIKNLYDHSTMHIRIPEGCTEDVDVSERVLQGEKLSPLLFNLYLSDFVSFFQARGPRGVDIDDGNDVILFLYADDLIVLANNSVELKRRAKILEEYCTTIGLTINISKTKVLVFRRGGALPARNHQFKLYGSVVEIVSSYVYLGIKLSFSSLGGGATKVAIAKAGAASALVIRIISKINAAPGRVSVSSTSVSSNRSAGMPPVYGP
ncbi:uncharacterized protein LOC107046669 [Diachasma alloeum]|uniref:uncharacterized protein LOC107046669 n=1 Tax=Diachasma alloeum TaxID=454923 RepID=UPI000738280B|nr:uncharacterized protein LOC107046669 [Diachasma alloeum]